MHVRPCSRRTGVRKAGVPASAARQDCSHALSLRGRSTCRPRPGRRAAEALRGAGTARDVTHGPISARAAPEARPPAAAASPTVAAAAARAKKVSTPHGQLQSLSCSTAPRPLAHHAQAMPGPGRAPPVVGEFTFKSGRERGMRCMMRTGAASSTGSGSASASASVSGGEFRLTQPSTHLSAQLRLVLRIPRPRVRRLAPRPQRCSVHRTVIRGSNYALDQTRSIV